MEVFLGSSGDMGSVILFRISEQKWVRRHSFFVMIEFRDLVHPKNKFRRSSENEDHSRP